jgi:3-phosphoshikimate 1-carboxyvinyltransferase
MQKTGSIAYIHPIAKPIDVRVTVPGSKSFTNRALIIAALANGISTMHGTSDSNDSEVLIKSLQRLGVEINSINGSLQVKGNGGKFNPFHGELDVEDAGTAMRFLTALCCIIPGEIVLKGSARMHQRPIKELVNALSQIGATITYLDKEGFPPIKIQGGTIQGGKLKVDGSISSQFISALLMITPVLPNNTEIIIEGEQVSKPYIEMTVSVMAHFGNVIRKIDYFNRLEKNQAYKATEYNVEGDASSATYLLGIAALTQSKITVTNLSDNSLQSDSRFADILQQMGCSVKKTESSITVTGATTAKAVEVNMQDMPDAAQTLAVVAAFAKGETVITGLKTLQLKESKRITALVNELGKMGIECQSGDDYIKIQGGNPKGAHISTYNDHRMAMAFAVAGTRINGISIESPQVVKKSFPAFWTTLQAMGINVETK